MTEVRIIIDPNADGSPAAEDVVVTCTSDHLRARSLQRQSSMEGEKVTIWVRTPAFATWFDDLKGEPNVRFENYELLEELARLLGVRSIPDVITRELVRRHELLGVASKVKLHQGESVLDWCYRVLLGDVWGRSEITSAHVSAVLESLAEKEGPELAELARARLSGWAGGSPDSSLLRWLADAPFKRARAVLAAYAVAPYGKMAIQWLTQSGLALDEAQQALEFAEAAEQWQWPQGFPLPTALQDQVQRALNSRLAKEGMPALRLARTRSPIELRAVLDHLRGLAGQHQLLDPTESQQLVAWCTDCKEGELVARLRAAAEMLREVPLPAPLSESTSWEEASQWIERQYLAAYWGRAVADRLEETTELVSSFETWFTGNFGQLMQDTHAGLHWFCAERRHLAEQALVVVVLLDGVPCTAMRWLCDKLARESVLTTETERLYLSAVPTLTRIAKPVLLSASLLDQAHSDPMQALAHSFGVSPEQCRNVSGLRDLGPPFAGQVVFHHFQSVDEALVHKPQPAWDRWLGCHDLLMRLGDELLELIHQARELDVPLWLGCVSDHGWTELPKSAPTVRLPEHLNEAETHRRVLEAVAEPACGLVLSAEEFFLPRDYTVARGYSCLGRRPQGATHGGLTPQEVAVYGFWMTTEAVAELQDLVLHVAGEIRRAVARNPARLEISNPNAHPVTIRALDLDVVQSPPDRLPITIAPHAQVELAVSCDASRCTDMMRVAGTVEWESQSGRRYQQQVDFWVPTTGAATSSREFEDMFRV